MFLNLPDGLEIFEIAATALAGLSSIAFKQLAVTFPPTAKPAFVIALHTGLQAAIGIHTYYGQPGWLCTQRL